MTGSPVVRCEGRRGPTIPGPMRFGHSREVDSDERDCVSCGGGFSCEGCKVRLFILQPFIYSLRNLYADSLYPKLWRYLKCPAV